MTAYGYEQTSSRPKSTSALPPNADVAAVDGDCSVKVVAGPGNHLPGDWNESRNRSTEW